MDPSDTATSKNMAEAVQSLTVGETVGSEQSGNEVKLADHSIENDDAHGDDDDDDGSFDEDQYNEDEDDDYDPDASRDDYTQDAQDDVFDPKKDIFRADQREVQTELAGIRADAKDQNVAVLGRAALAKMNGKDLYAYDGEPFVVNLKQEDDAIMEA